MGGQFAAFIGACMLIALSPGPSTVLIVRQSLRSRRAGMWTVLGNESGVFVWGLCAALGLTAVLEASRVAYDVIHMVGAVVLLGFGVQALRAARRGDLAGLAPAAPAEGATDWRDYRSGLLLNLANPKAGVFALAFLPQFVPEGAPHFAAMVALAAIWAVFEVGFYACYVWGVSRLSVTLSRPGVRRRLEQISGGVMIALGIRLALET
ncbi:LysE family translocator [Streptomyces sp. MS19]|uniref:LysE family translocator n=1 Tax=Streptomyces sp. MS19 TaxID=3385972 RepID=UPI0039A3460C